MVDMAYMPEAPSYHCHNIQNYFPMCFPLEVIGIFLLGWIITFLFPVPPTLPHDVFKKKIRGFCHHVFIVDFKGRIIVRPRLVPPVV